MVSVISRCQVHYIVLYHLSVMWKSVTQLARKRKISSYTENIFNSPCLKFQDLLFCYISCGFWFNAWSNFLVVYDHDFIIYISFEHWKFTIFYFLALCITVITTNITKISKNKLFHKSSEVKKIGLILGLNFHILNIHHALNILISFQSILG